MTTDNTEYKIWTIETKTLWHVGFKRSVRSNIANKNVSSWKLGGMYRLPNPRHVISVRKPMYYLYYRLVPIMYFS